MNVLSLIPVLATADAAADSTPVNTATVLFVAVVLLLGAFFIGIVLLTIGRRHAGMTRKKAEATAELDPWSEAGKRAEPIAGRTADDDEGDESDDDDEPIRRDS